MNDINRLGPNDVSALIMKGGGVKGIAFVGALEVLDQHGYEFEEYVGTSAGAITAVLLACGYSPSELRQVLTKAPFRSFLDANPIAGILNLLTKGGMHPGRRMKEWVDKTAREKIGTSDHSNPIRMRDLSKRAIAFASHPFRGTIAFDSRGERQDRPIGHAVRLSSSIPGLFIPGEDDGERVYDGGLIHNFPVEVYQRIGAQEDRPQKDDFIALYLGIPRKPRQWWFLEAWAALWSRDETVILSEYDDRSIRIQTYPISATDFDLSELEQEFLLLSGRVAALKFCGQDAEVEKQEERLSQLRKGAKQKRRLRRVAGWTKLMLVLAVFGALFFLWHQGRCTIGLKDDLRLVNTYVDEERRVARLGNKAKDEISKIYSQYNDSYVTDLVPLSEIVQIVLIKNNGEARKLVIGTGSYAGGPGHYLRNTASNDELSTSELETIQAVLTKGKDQESFEILAKKWEDVPHPPSASWSPDEFKQLQVSIKGLEQDTDFISFLGATYPSVWTHAEEGIERIAEPWVLHSHRGVSNGSATYLFLAESEAAGKFPNDVYIYTAGGRWFTRLSLSCKNIQSKIDLRRIEWVTDQIKILRATEGAISPGLELLLSEIEPILNEPQRTNGAAPFTTFSLELRNKDLQAQIGSSVNRESRRVGDQNLLIFMVNDAIDATDAP